MRINRKKRSGLVALAAVAASVALSGIGAGTSQAALLTACTGQNIDGQGSSLQALAQSAWNGTTGSAGFNINALGCSVAPNKPTSMYTSTSSGQCMKKWHSDGTSTFDTTVHFCGTDDAPTTTQIANINASVVSGGSGSSVLSIPVAQAAIAVLVNPPVGCTISTITAADLEKVFRANITTWAGITGTSGCGSNAITRVVRADSSGTTYQLKHYLFSQFTGNVMTSPNRTWADLQDPTLNTTWPGTVTYSKSGCGAVTCSGGVASGSGGGDEAKTVGVTAGSIGYAALPDARKVYASGVYASYKWITVKGPGQLAASDPSTNTLNVATQRSNCPTANGTYGASLPSATSSWAGVYQVAASTGYSLCTLTYDLAVADYSQKWGVSPGRSIATTVHDYLGYVVAQNGGQADALAAPAAFDYAALPGDVRTAAIGGVAQITD
jgi:hypothetical protein